MRGGRKSRETGKRGEYYFRNKLRTYFPKIATARGEQSGSHNTNDLISCSPFEFEVKYGVSYKNVKNRKMLEQAQSQGEKYNLKTVLVKVPKEHPYILMSFSDFETVLQMLKAEKII